MTIPLHRPWCGRHGAPHAACVRLLDDIPLTTDLRLIIQLHQAAAMAPLLTLTADRAGRQQLTPVSIQRAPRLAVAVDRAVRLALDDPFAG